MSIRGALLTLPPSPSLLSLLALAFVLPGLFGHDPWKSFDAIGVEIVYQMYASGDWLVPRIAGVPWLEDPPFFHWISLGLAAIATHAMPFHDAARIASGVAVLVACAFLYAAAKVGAPAEDRRTEASAAVLLLLGTLGLMVHAHEAIPDLATLAASSAALAAMRAAADSAARPAVRTAVLGAAFGAALGIAFLSTGLVTPLALYGAALLSAAVCREWRNRRFALFLCVAGLAGILVSTSWPLALRMHSPALFDAWLAQATQTRGSFRANLAYFFSISGWFLWPVWPLALWTFWANRDSLLTPRLFAPLAAFACLAVAVSTTGPTQDISLLATVPPLVLFAAYGLPTLRRGAAAALDWFGVMSFACFGALIWLGYIAMMTGWPPKIANNFAKLAPGFVPQFSVIPFAVALGLTLLWLALVLRLPPAPSRSATRWCAGMVLLWGCFSMLLLPWADHLKSYRSVAVQLKTHIPAGEDCVVGRNFGTPQRAALSYHSGLRVLVAEPVPHCRFLIVQGSPKHERDAPGAGWIKLADVGRAGDKAERFRLYRATP